MKFLSPNHNFRKCCRKATAPASAANNLIRNGLDLLSLRIAPGSGVDANRHPAHGFANQCFIRWILMQRRRSRVALIGVRRPRAIELRPLISHGSMLGNGTFATVAASQHSIENGTSWNRPAVLSSRLNRIGSFMGVIVRDKERVRLINETSRKSGSNVSTKRIAAFAERGTFGSGTNCMHLVERGL
jgi:hypothetical protein